MSAQLDDPSVPTTARRLLGVGPDAAPHEIRVAFRQAARAGHPDSGGRSADLAALRMARDTLLHRPAGHQPSGARQRVFVRRAHPLRRAVSTVLRRRRPRHRFERSGDH